LHYTKRHTHKNSSQTLVRNIALHSSWFPCQASLHAWFHPRRMRFHAKDCTRTARATERKQRQKKKNRQVPRSESDSRISISRLLFVWFVSNNDWLEMTKSMMKKSKVNLDKCKSFSSLFINAICKIILIKYIVSKKDLI